MVYYCFTHITQALETENIGGAIWAYWSARLSGPGRHQDLKCFDGYLSTCGANSRLQIGPILGQNPNPILVAPSDWKPYPHVQ